VAAFRLRRATGNVLAAWQVARWLLTRIGGRAAWSGVPWRGRAGLGHPVGDAELLESFLVLRAARERRGLADQMTEAQVLVSQLPPKVRKFLVFMFTHWHSASPGSAGLPRR
jgi:hypothetical protein